MESLENQSVTPEQHPDFLWTWKSNRKGSKVSIWLPYFSDVQKVPKKNLWTASYNGGSIDLELASIDFIMFYGATGQLPLEFLDDAAKNNIVILIHRRNVVDPYVFYPTNQADPEDILTKQISFRQHAQKRAYIAKTLIRERLTKMSDTIVVAPSTLRKLASSKSITEIRSIEAVVTARYWDSWFEKMGVELSRRQAHPINSALDAGSKFLFGVILRWVVFHKLSPNHGFLHESTTYPSLIYDLIEPYRYVIESAAQKAWEKSGGSEKSLVSHTLSQIKDDLEEVCFVSATRQYVRKKNLLHGVVLALRSYLLGETKRLVVPTEDQPNGGRPPKVSYSLPGSVYDCKRRKPKI